MAFADLREFLTLLEGAGELKRVEKEVSPQYELAAICRKLIAKGGPTVWFTRVDGSPAPVVSNLLATRKRMALALECQEQDILKLWLNRSLNRVEPKIIPYGPCKDVITRDFDLTRFPVPVTWNEGDGGPYITFALFVCKNPQTGKRNVGLYRIQVKGPKRTGAGITPPQHAGICLQIAESMGRPLECALAIGVDPVCYLASQAPLGFGEDEFVLASSLRGEPVELVKCETVDLEVPSTAEIVLEGRVLPNVREPEGPFGEWTGYVCGSSPRPVAEFTCMTHRKNPIYLVTYEGYPGEATSILMGTAREPELFRHIQTYSCPTVKDVCLTPGGLGGLHVVVSIKKQAEGQAVNVILDLLASHLFKHVVVVDEDVDPRDSKKVEWAIATRVQADKDVIIVPTSAGMRLDPSQPGFPTGVGAKMGIDATRPLARDFPPVVKVPDDVMRRVETRWQEYGL